MLDQNNFNWLKLLMILAADRDYVARFWTLAVPFPEQSALGTVYSTFMKGRPLASGRL